MRRLLAIDWASLATIDTRSLALFRIIIAFVVIGDLAWRLPDLNFFMTDAGALPRVDLWRLDNNHYSWSLHVLSGTWAWQFILWMVHLAAAVALALGWRTRLATILTWGLCVSLQSRNYQIVQGGDVLLRCLLFWAMFLPLGARASVDAWRAEPSLEPGQKPRPTAVRNAASLAILLQISLIYLCTGILKWDPAWHTQGNALWYALNLDQFATPIGRWLRTQETWLPWLTRGTLGLELIGPFLAFMPWRNAHFRSVVVLAFFSLHLGMLACLELGPFPYVCFAGWALFIPSHWWSWRPTRPVALAPPLTRMSELVVLLLLTYVLLWNARTINFARVAPLFPPVMNGLIEIPRLDQMWAMFAPSPLREDGWYVARAELGDGTVIDLITGMAPHEEAPAGAPYANERWRKYLVNLSTGEGSPWRPAALAALKRRWDSRHPQAPVISCELRFWRKTNRLGGPPECHVEIFAKIP